MLDQANDLRELVRQCAMPHSRPAVPPPRRIVLCGGKGGVGTTTLGVNLAAMLTRLGTPAEFVDAAAESSRHTPCAVRWTGEASGGWHTACACCFVFDVGNRPDRLARRLWTAADERLFITTPGTAAIMDSYATIRLLTQPGPAQPIRLVVNAAPRAEAAVEAHRRLALVCRRFLGVTLIDGGYVPMDAEIPKGAWNKEPFVLTAPKTAASRSLDRLANLVNSQCFAKPQAAVS
jgi:MinD-like ATPase involved in chromosome partitioning or flagellar assembly